MMTQVKEDLSPRGCGNNLRIEEKKMSRCDNNCCADDCDSYTSKEHSVPNDDVDALKEAIEFLGYHVDIKKKTFETVSRGY